MESETKGTDNKQDAIEQGLNIEQTKNKKINIKKIIYIALTIGLMIATGVGVWFYMNEKNKDESDKDKQQITNLTSQIALLTKQQAMPVLPSTTPTPTSTTIDGNKVESLKIFCLGNDSDTTVGSIQYVNNQNGQFGLCGIGSKSEPMTGGMFIAVYQQDKWSKVWSGNGVMDSKYCTQYKIPKSIYGDCTGYYQ